jgi:predicted phage terminase large subunit-like protein
LSKIRIKLHQKQADFLDRTSTKAGFVGGRGAGKTFIGAYDLLRRAQPNCTYMVASVTYGATQDFVLPAFFEMARKLNCLAGYNKSRLIATLGNGATVRFRTAEDPEKLRGPNLSGIWFDEASQIKREAFEIAIACLREHGKMGWISATYTPKGRTHWTYEVFHKSDRAEEFHATTRDNPFLPPEFYDEVRHEYSGLRAEQELEGRYVDIEGAEWPAEFFADDIWFTDWPTKYDAKTAALDPSKGKGSKHGDYSAFVKLMLADGVLYCDADLANNRHVTTLADVAVDMQLDFGADAFGVETNQFQELLAFDIRDKATRRNVFMPMKEIDNHINKEVRIRRLTYLLSMHTLKFKAQSKGAEMLVNQMRDFPLAQHDDGPDALEMAHRLMQGVMHGRKLSQDRITNVFGGGA